MRSAFVAADEPGRSERGAVSRAAFAVERAEVGVSASTAGVCGARALRGSARATLRAGSLRGRPSDATPAPVDVVGGAATGAAAVAGALLGSGVTARGCTGADPAIGGTGSGFRKIQATAPTSATPSPPATQPMRRAG